MSAEDKVAKLVPMMPNIDGSKRTKCKILAEVVHSIILCGTSPILVLEVLKKKVYHNIVERVQRRILRKLPAACTHYYC